METCKRVIGGANLTCPNQPWMIFPSDDPNDYDGCCGAGEAGSWTEALYLSISLGCGFPLRATFMIAGGASASAPLPSSGSRTVFFGQT